MIKTLLLFGLLSTTLTVHASEKSLFCAQIQQLLQQESDRLITKAQELKENETELQKVTQKHAQIFKMGKEVRIYCTNLE